jgi:perosamine synthetase
MHGFEENIIMDNFIPVNLPLLNGNEKKYLNECIDTGWISSEGPFVTKFEEDFSIHIGRKYGIAVSNGTAAIDIAIEALGIKEGDEIIMPTFTIISCINQIIRSKAVPVLIDSHKDSWNMDVSEIESKITSKTKAIMIVHIYGLSVDIDPIIELSKKYNLKIIEDAAEVHGLTYKNKPCGSFGDISTFSFYPNKHITTGEGGMVLTNDEQLAEKCRGLRNLCFTSEKRFVHTNLGWNMRMTNMQAALGCAQLENIENFIKLKRDMGAIYQNELRNVDELQLPLKKDNNSENIYWVFGVVLKNKNINSEMVMKELAKKGIGTRPFFYPMHLQPVLKNKGLFNGESYPVSENLYNQGFYLPSGLGTKKNEFIKAANALKEVLIELK